LEVLEDRLVPATLQVVNGMLTYTAANGIANRLDVSASSAGTYTFQDTAETITVVGIPGAVGGGTKIVTVPTSQVPPAGISINLGDKNDTLTINSSLHAISVKAGADNDTVDVGAPVGGLLIALGGPVTVDGEGGIDSVRVNDPSGFLGSYTVTANQVTRSSGFSMTYAAENLTLNGGFFADTFDIRSTATGTKSTVNGGPGTDVFRVGNEANTLDGIQGTLLLNGGAQDNNFGDQVILNDQGSTARSYTFRADPFVARTGSAMIGYGEMEGLTLNAGNFADSAAVLTTFPGTPLALNMGTGDDRVTLGTPTTQSLNTIAAPVTVNGEIGTDTVVLNDQTNALQGSYGITGTTVNYGALGLLNYAGVEGLTLNGTANNDVVWVSGTSVPTVLKMGAGNDSVTVSSVDMTIDSMLGALTVDGQADSDTLLIDDHGSRPFDFTVMTNSVTRFTPTTATAVGYAGMEQLTVATGVAPSPMQGGFRVLLVKGTSAATQITTGTFGSYGFFLGNDAQSMDDIHGPVTFAGQNVRSIALNDQGDGNGNAYAVTASSVTRNGAPLLSYFVSNHTMLPSMDLNAGARGDTVTVTSTAYGLTLRLSLGAGNDTVVVDDGALAGQAGIASSFDIDGGLGTDTVVVDDSDAGTVPVSGKEYRIISTDMQRDGKSLFTYAAVDGLTVLAGSGDDMIRVASTAAQTPVVIRAGLGNDNLQLQGLDAPGLAGAVTADGEGGTDTLDYWFYTTDVRVNLALGTATGAAGGVSNFENAEGGSGNDILIGNDQDNVFFAGGGRDLLIGRGGADSLNGEGQDDILVGASTAHDLLPARLEDVMREWTRIDLNGPPQSQYDTRVSHLLGITPGGLNGATTLTPGQVTDDGVGDALDGGTELDWYLASADDSINSPAPFEGLTYAPAPVAPVVGNITAVFLGGNLYLSEAAGSEGLKQGLTISRLPNGNILVSGHDPTNTGGIITLINGALSVEYPVTGSLFVNVGDGEDQLVFGGQDPLLWPTFTDVVINTGTDDAEDRIIVWGLSTRGSMSVDTGGGDDWVFLGGAVIGDGIGFDQLTINTGAGSDNVTVKNGSIVNGWLDIQTYGSLSETDLDVVYFDTEAYVLRDVDVRTGGGNDLVFVTDPNLPDVVWGGLTTRGSLTINMGDGADEAYLRAAAVGGNLSVLTGTGGDRVTIDNRSIMHLDGSYFIAWVGGNLLVQTYDTLAEIDRDEVRIVGATVTGNLTVQVGGGNDFFSIDNAGQAEHNLTVDMGTGNDEAEISTWATDHLMVWMGDGNDVLRLGYLWAYRLIADGGLDFDTLTTTLGTQAQYMDLFSWELINP
jgi:hypothetical protein